MLVSLYLSTVLLLIITIDPVLCNRYANNVIKDKNTRGDDYSARALYTKTSAKTLSTSSKTSRPTCKPTARPTMGPKTVKPSHVPTNKPTQRKTLMPTENGEESSISSNTDDAIATTNKTKKKGVLLISISTVLLVLLLVTSVAYYLHLKQKQEEYNTFILKSRQQKQRDISIVAGEKTSLIGTADSDDQSDEEKIPTGYITGEEGTSGV